ncbi:MAG: GNAT family N-acetyltransferase [Euryarchaeota archaeon]|nr:GNAT family N-acetyltransferase [Euryarchaeota archaeon]
MAGRKVRVEPVTPARWDDFERLFTGRGCPSYCWCTPYRFKRSHLMKKAERRGAMEKRVKDGGPVGVLAYVGDEPIGWCSVAPRESYEKLDGSRSMPRVSDEPTWTVLCFFVRRDHRHGAVTKALLEGAMRYAKALGGHVVEGYPYDTAGITSRHRGHSRLFKSQGFEREGRRWSRRIKPARKKATKARAKPKASHGT